jgi:hypothetical protein
MKMLADVALESLAAVAAFLARSGLFLKKRWHVGSVPEGERLVFF